MKNQLQALVVSNQNFYTKILNWKLEYTKTAEDALMLIQEKKHCIIAIDNAMEHTEKLKVKAIASLLNETILIVCFSTEKDLEVNIKQAFRSQRASSIQHKFLDNAFEIELACNLNGN